MKKMLLLLFLLPLISFISAGCDNDSNAEQGVEAVEELAVDFLQNIISGTVEEKISDTEFVLRLELSPNTVFMADLPVRTAGRITTESFYDNFDSNFPDSFPNAILSINDGDVASAIPFELKNPVFDPQTGTVEVIASPLELIPGSTAAAVNVISFEELTSPFGQGSLFIDDATNTCVGLVFGVCSSGFSSDAGGCTMDGECTDSGATCEGGSTGFCSVTGESCADELCCTNGIGCLSSPIGGI